MKKRFLLGFITGAFSVVVGLVVISILYYNIASSSGLFEKNMEKNLRSPNIILADPSCYKNFDVNLSFTAKDGSLKNLNDFSGKVIFLNLWQTTCVPCIAEMKSINKLYNHFKNKGVEFILISNESNEKVFPFMEAKDFDFPVYVIDATILKTSVIYSGTFPVTHVITKQGTLAIKEMKAADWYSDEVIELLESLTQSNLEL